MVSWGIFEGDWYHFDTSTGIILILVPVSFWY